MTTTAIPLTTDIVSLERRGSLLWVTFDGHRPFDGVFWQQLHDTLTVANSDPDQARALVLHGGDTFAVGNSLPWMSSAIGKALRRGHSDPYASVSDIQAATAMLLNSIQIPTIAAVSGSAIGAGLELACLTDLRVAIGASPITIALPEPQLGVVPDLAPMSRILAVLGHHTARQLLFTGTATQISACSNDNFIDRWCDTVATAYRHLTAHPTEMPQGPVVPALRDLERRAVETHDARATNAAICPPDRFRLLITDYAERKYA